MTYLLKNGLVWHDSGFKKQDLFIEDQNIAVLGDDIAYKCDREIDCTDCYIIPGLIDIHVHTGEPISGILLAEDERITSLSCLKSGVTTIGVFITETANETLDVIYPIRKKQFYRLPLTARWHLTPTKSKLADLKNLLLQDCDIKLYTTYKEAGLYSSYKKIADMMVFLKDINTRLRKYPARLLVHCEDNEIIKAKQKSIPFTKPFDHTLRRPESAEIKAVEKILDLAVQHNFPVHIVHVSTPQAALLINEAKRSVPVTCETAPQYLFLNEEMLHRKDGHRWLCTPPLRPESSRGKMVELAQEGIFDIFATDHCPYTIYDKDRYASEPEKVPMGLPGVGALLPLLYEGLVASGKISFSDLILRLTTNPAKILNLFPDKGIIQENADADLVILKIDNQDPKNPILPSTALTHNPWKNRYSSLTIKKIFVDGNITIDD